MVTRPTFLTTAWLAIATASIAPAQTLRSGQEPYRLVEDTPGYAYVRTTPTPGASFRPIITNDNQIGPSTTLDQILHLADELDRHLTMSYKHSVPEYYRRYVHFRNVMDEWGKSPQGVSQQVQMTQWLKTSIKASMPGSEEFLPPMPTFNPNDQNNELTRSPDAQDPFRDDPVQLPPM